MYMYAITTTLVSLLSPITILPNCKVQMSIGLPMMMIMMIEDRQTDRQKAVE